MLRIGMVRMDYLLHDNCLCNSAPVQHFLYFGSRRAAGGPINASAETTYERMPDRPPRQTSGRSHHARDFTSPRQIRGVGPVIMPATDMTPTTILNTASGYYPGSGAQVVIGVGGGWRHFRR